MAKTTVPYKNICSSVHDLSILDEKVSNMNEILEVLKVQG